MKLTSINCPNCNGQLREEGDKLICTMCGSAFAIDYDESDVEHEKLKTEAERERIRIEREKELMATKMRLEEEAQIRRAERARKQISGGMLKFLLIPVILIFVGSICSFIFFGVVARNVSKRSTSFLNSTTKTSSVATSKPTEPALTKDTILNDQSFVENALASGVSFSKTKHSGFVNDFDLKSELNLSMVPQATLSGEPKLVNVYFIEADTTYFIMVYELTFGYDQDIDRTKTMYFSCYLSGISRNDAGKIASDYNVKMDYGTGMDLSYSAYADKDQLYREVVLGRGGNCEDLTADLVK